MSKLSTSIFVPSLKKEVTLFPQWTGKVNDDKEYPGYLGCHFRWAGDFGLYASNLIGETFTETVRYCNSKEWNGVSEEEQNRLFTAIAASFGCIRTKAENSYGPTPAGTPSGPTFVVLSDNINSYTPEFPKNSGINNPTKLAKGFKTSDFVQWLVKKKCGIVVATPVGRNHWHQNDKNFSLVQAWFWIPPHHASFTVPGSHYVSGLDLQPTWDQWYDDVRKASGMSKRTNEQIDERMWKGGKRNSHLDALGSGNSAC